MAYVKKTYSDMVADSINRAKEQNLRIEEISEDKCLVVNIEKRTIYTVWMDTDYVKYCDCLHHTYRKVPCKHLVIAAEYFNKMF